LRSSARRRRAAEPRRERVVADVVRNVGTHTAPASTTGYYLGRIRIGDRGFPACARAQEVTASVICWLAARGIVINASLEIRVKDRFRP
jgi:hypothetical protein